MMSMILSPSGNSDCESAPCKNGASCQPFSTGPGVYCVCLSGFYGQYCETRKLDFKKHFLARKSLSTKCLAQERKMSKI